MKVKSESEVSQSYLTLHNCMNCSLLGSSVHGIFQARVLEWVAIAFSAAYARKSHTMSLICFLLLIVSLWKHLKKMQLSGKGSPDPSTKVHIKAMQTVISSLLLFAIHFLALMGSIWSFKRQQKEPVFLFFEALGFLCPSNDSCTLFGGNRKLTKAFLSFLWQLRC